MAVHAGPGWRNSCVARFLDRRVAVPAVEALASDVMQMAELDRLLNELVLLGEPRGPHQDQQDPGDEGEERDGRGNGRLREGVGLLREGMTHRNWQPPCARRRAEARSFELASQAFGSRGRSGLGSVGDAAGGRQGPLRRLYNVKR